MQASEIQSAETQGSDMTQHSGGFVASVRPIERTIDSERTLVRDLRKDALKHFTALGVPTARNEDWKYTSLQELARTTFAVQAAAETVPLDRLAPWIVPDAIRLVFVNGRFSTELSSDLALSSTDGALQIRPIREALEQDSALRELFGTVLAYREHAFAAMNTALLGDGAYIRVKKGKVIAQPIQLLFVAGKGHSATVIPSRTFVYCEEASECTLVETYLGLGDNMYLTSAATEVVCEQRSIVDHTKVQVEGASAYHLASLGVRQHAASKFSSHVFSFGGKTVRNEVHPILAGENIESYLNGLTVIRDEQHVDNSTVIDHAKPSCFSRELYKGIYNDESSGAFSGTIIVRQDAQKTNAIQSNQTLLLSDEATVDTRPQLKIYADDVKCTHGATIGQLDENGMFYLRSRGIGKTEARNMLIHAFASDIISYVPVAALRDQLEAQLMDQLGEDPALLAG